jgi:hypothetical protein
MGKGNCILRQLLRKGKGKVYFGTLFEERESGKLPEGKIG